MALGKVLGLTGGNTFRDALGKFDAGTVDVAEESDGKLLG